MIVLVWTGGKCVIFLPLFPWSCLADDDFVLGLFRRVPFSAAELNPLLHREKTTGHQNSCSQRRWMLDRPVCELESARWPSPPRRMRSWGSLTRSRLGRTTSAPTIQSCAAAAAPPTTNSVPLVGVHREAPEIVDPEKKRAVHTQLSLLPRTGRDPGQALPIQSLPAISAKGLCLPTFPSPS